MGLFSIGKVNTLLAETEKQLAKFSTLHDCGGGQLVMRQAVNELRQLMARLSYQFTDSYMARVSVYTFLERKCRSWDVMSFLKDTIKEMEDAVDGMV